MMNERELGLLADKLKPYIVDWLPSSATSSGTSSNGMVAHDIGGSYHSGTLRNEQAPQFSLIDGTRAFTGSVTIVGNLLLSGTVDGVDLSAHASNASAHHAPVTAGTLISLSGQQVSLVDGSAQYQFITTGASPFTPTYASLSTLKGNGLTYAAGVLTLGTPTGLSDISTDAVTTSSHSHSIDSTIARSAITVTGTGALGGGGNLTANRTISLNTPGTLTVATGNSSATNHTHSIASDSAPGAAASILASDNTGKLTLPLFVATTSVTTPSLTSSAALAITTSSGNISLDASTGIISIGASNLLKSANYTSQTTGWGIDYNGGADFRYLYTDELHAKSFIADLEQALAGGQIISKSVAILAIDFTVPAAGATATLRVKDLPSAANMAVFQSGDIVRLRSFSRASGALTIGNCWGVVTSYTDQSDGTQTWTFTRSTSTNAGSITAGTVINADSIVLDYGTSGNGFYEVNAIDGTYAANSPYWQIATWTTHPATGTSVNVRGGKLTGITSTANEFGLFAGSGVTSSDSFVKISNVEVVQNNVDSAWSSGGTNLVTIDATHGLSLQTFDATGSVISWGDQRVISWAETIGATPDGALWAQRETGFNGFYLRANQVGSQVGYFDITADGSGDTNLFLTGGVSGGAAASATLYTHDVLIDLGSGTSGTGTFTAYVSQLLLNDLTTGGGDGSAATPIISFVGDTNTGIYRSAADTLNISTGGTSRVTVTTSAFAAFSDVDSQNIVGKAKIGYIGNADGAGFQHYDMPVDTSSYALLQQATGRTYLNCASTADIRFRHGNVDVMAMNSIGLRIGSATAATQALDVTGNAYVSANIYADGVVESGQAAISGNLSSFTGRNGASSSIALSAHSWGNSGALTVNANFANNSGSYTAGGAFKFLGAQYTGNVTKAGMFHFDGNSNDFSWYTSEAGLTSGANITTWTENLKLQDDGTLTLFGDLAWSSGGFAAAWSSLTYNTGWASYGSPYKAASYCKIGDLVMVNGLVLRSSGTSSTIGTLPSGYRPTTNKIFDARASIDSVIQSIRVDVDTSGNILATNLSGSSTVGFISLDNIQFRTNS